MADKKEVGSFSRLWQSKLPNERLIALVFRLPSFEEVGDLVNQEKLDGRLRRSRSGGKGWEWYALV